ncbi:MAG: hypothetical protein WA014_01160 [Minisyncoccia bacterium]
MYADSATVDPNTLYQGDILENFPFYILDKPQSVKKEEDGSFSLEQEAATSDLHVIGSKTQRVILLSQTCDIQRRNNVMICPVHELAQFIEDNTLNTDSVKSIRDRKNYYFFYLPAFNGLPESIADLQTIIYVPRAVIAARISDRIVPMSDLGRHHLGWSLANLFSRPATN